MTISKIILPIKAFPKPRGQLGKYGNMTHSAGGYRAWQNQFSRLIQSTSFHVPDTFHSMVFQFNICTTRGRAPDLSNLQGGVEDALVKQKYLQDDNWKILTRFYTFGKVAPASEIIIYVAECKKELLYIIEHFST